MGRGLRIIAVGIIALIIGACSSSDIEEALDIVDVDRKPIDTSRLGVNAFVNDPAFGSISEQFAEIRDTLRLNRVRLLFAWDDGVQPAPGAPLNLGFYDSIAARIPDGIEAIVVLTGTPSWMDNPANWIEGNPRTTFVESFLRPVVSRYAGNGRITGWQVWNEPNMTANPDNITMDLAVNGVNYVELLARSQSIIKSVSPGKLVLNAATTAINQNYPGSLDYNKAMRDAGAQMFVDRWAVHYYGQQFENVVRDGGVEDFLNGLSVPIWLTESGAQGFNSQLGYGEETWPFLIDHIPGIERIYIYQFVEASPADVTYGLRNPTPGFELSDLYVFLRDR